MNNSQRLRSLCENLFESKVVYREKFVGLVRLENIDVSETGFWATAFPLFDITPKRFVRARGLRLPPKPWRFGSRGWGGMGLNEDHSLVCPYGGWTIWLAPDLVRSVELLARAGMTEMAIRLLHGRDFKSGQSE